MPFTHQRRNDGDTSVREIHVNPNNNYICYIRYGYSYIALNIDEGIGISLPQGNSNTIDNLFTVIRMGRIIITKKSTGIDRSKRIIYFSYNRVKYMIPYTTISKDEVLENIL